MMKNIPYPVIDIQKTGDNIKRIREKRHVSVAELQRYLGLSSPQAIYQWQKGICLPSVDNLCALSHLFDVSMNDIIVLAEAPESTPSTRQCVVPRSPFMEKTMMLLAAA